MAGKVRRKDSVEPREGGTAVDPPFVPLLQSFTLRCYIDCKRVQRRWTHLVDAHELQTEYEVTMHFELEKKKSHSH